MKSKTERILEAMDAIYTSFSWKEEGIANNRACARSRLTRAYCGKVPHTSNGKNLI